MWLNENFQNALFWLFWWIFILTRNEFPRTISSTLAPEGGAASLLEARPIEEEVDILDKSDESEETLGHEDWEAAEDKGIAEETLGHEDWEAAEDKGIADETEEMLEVEVNVALDSSEAASARVG